MLYYCAYTWNPGVTIEDVGPAILEQHDAGTLHPEWIRGYYGLVGGGAGFLILDVEDPLRAQRDARPVDALHDLGRPGDRAVRL